MVEGVDSRHIYMVKSAGDVRWKAFTVTVYPRPGGAHMVLEVRHGHGGTYRIERILGGPVDLGETPSYDDLGATLLACSDALALAADRMQRPM